MLGVADPLVAAPCARTEQSKCLGILAMPTPLASLDGGALREHSGSDIALAAVLQAYTCAAGDARE